MMSKKLNLIIFIFVFFTTNLFAVENCSEERKQWVEFYKKEFAQNFYEINYGDDPCLISVVSIKFSKNDEKVFISESQNVNQEIIQKLPNDLDINWVPEYFELDAKDDYLYGAQYFASKKYDEAALFLRDYLEKNPKDKLAAKAQYLFAETFRLREDYIEAADQYLNGYENYPLSNHKYLYLLKLSEMLIKINYHKEGCKMMEITQNELKFSDVELFNSFEEQMLKYQCQKVIMPDSDILLVDLINNSKKLIQ